MYYVVRGKPGETINSCMFNSLSNFKDLANLVEKINCNNSKDPVPDKKVGSKADKYWAKRCAAGKANQAKSAKKSK